MALINCRQEEALRTVAKLQTEIITGGILYLYIEGRTIKWKEHSLEFDLEIFRPGTDVKDDSFAVRAMQEQKVLKNMVPREMYGVRLTTVAMPVVNDEGVSVGAFSVVVPREHPVGRSFKHFAPLMTELFPEGAFLYIADRQQIMYIQGSKKFTLENMHVGYKLKETDLAYKVMQSQQPQTMDIGAERYGVPVYIATYPLLDDESGQRKVVGAMGVVVPKGSAGKLKNMSGQLTDNLNGIVQTVASLAQNAETINENEKDLYTHIHKVTEMVEKINSISTFISGVASQTNMLGLNAAIEAARAGEQGRGFAVVAEEIRKLAGQSADTVKKIQEMVNNIKTTVNLANQKSEESIGTNEQQAASMQEITASMEELSTLAKDLNDLAEHM